MHPFPVRRHDSPPIDLDRLTDSVGGDASVVADLLLRVIAELPGYMAYARESLVAGELGSVEVWARSLARMFGSLLAGPATELSQEVEAAAMRQRKDEVVAAFAELEIELDRLLHMASGFRSARSH